MGRKVTIAIEGCGHGELDKIYATLQLLEQREGKKIDLLICCGDFQAVRNLDDLETMACPPKYRSMQTFYKYYSGERVAPFPTLFIGGNHEAANHLWELYYGGWAAPNIYFMGYAGAVRFGGLRIAGLSGIYKGHDYTRGHHEALPYTDSTIRSMYHVRDFEVYRLLQLLTPTDIFLSHDWPTNIARYGNTAQLLSRKSFLRSEVEDGSLGSPPAAQLLQALRPAYWFSAHLHTKFAALVQHPPAPAAAAAGANGGADGAAGAERQGGGAAGAEGERGRGQAQQRQEQAGRGRVRVRAASPPRASWLWINACRGETSCRCWSWRRRPTGKTTGRRCSCATTRSGWRCCAAHTTSPTCASGTRRCRAWASCAAGRGRQTWITCSRRWRRAAAPPSPTTSPSPRRPTTRRRGSARAACHSTTSATRRRWR